MAEKFVKVRYDRNEGTPSLTLTFGAPFTVKEVLRLTEHKVLIVLEREKVR